VSVELRRRGRDNSLHYFEFGPQYLFQLLAVNIIYHTFNAKRGSALMQAVGKIGHLKLTLRDKKYAFHHPLKMKNIEFVIIKIKSECTPDCGSTVKYCWP